MLATDSPKLYRTTLIRDGIFLFADQCDFPVFVVALWDSIPMLLRAAISSVERDLIVSACRGKRDIVRLVSQRMARL